MVVRGAIAAAVAVAIVMSLVWWRKRSEDREAMRKALPPCVARLGSESECRARMDEHHRVCFNYNNRSAGRGTPRIFDDQGYV